MKTLLWNLLMVLLLAACAQHADAADGDLRPAKLLSATLSDPSEIDFNPVFADDPERERGRLQNELSLQPLWLSSRFTLTA